MLICVLAYGIWTLVQSLRAEREVLRALQLGDPHGRMPPEGTNILVSVCDAAIPVLLRWSHGKDPAWYKAANPVRKYFNLAPLGGKPWEHKEDARKAFAALRERGASAVPKLLLRLSDPDPDVRRYAVHMLGAIGPSIGSAAFQQMTNCLSDVDDNVRNDVVWALQFHRPSEYPAEALLPVYLSGLRDSFWLARQNAMGGLLLLGEKAAPARPAIEKAATDANEGVNRQAQRWLDGKFRKEWDRE